jgi:enamine deaminase RidA (YjgF/YER057c/UK114 family)
MDKEYFNPQELGTGPRSYSLAVAVQGPMRLVFVSGQISLDANGNVVGKGDIRAQCEQVFKNLGTVLNASGASWNAVIKTNAYIVDMDDAKVAAFREVRSRVLKPVQLPASTLVGVTRLAHPDFLVEVEAIAAL